MARRIHSRLKIAGTLVAETPMHVGGFGGSVDTDLPLAQNGQGKWYVPGTSLAGVLRGWCEKNFGEGYTDKIFGWKSRETDKEKRKEDIEKDQHASFVLVEDATIEEADEVLTEIRDSVGIDRYYGVAADKAKFNRAILPRGTKMNFLMTVEIGEDHDANKTKAIIGNLLAALTASKVRFGAARTRGLGRVRLGNGRIREDVFDKPDGILNLLKILSSKEEEQGKTFATLTSWLDTEEIKEALKANEPNSPPHLEINITWKPCLPVMVKAGYDGIGVDMLPLTSGVDKGELALCLPGSSIKGALRSHAERIVRTVLDCENKRFQTKGKRDFHDQIKALPLIDELFGAKKEKDAKQERLGLGALAIDDCYATETMNAAAWRKVETARDDKPEDEAKQKDQASAGESKDQSEQGAVSYFKRELWQYLREIDKQRSHWSEADYAKDTSRFRINHHVAIDRWTGGASEGALYSVLAPTKVDWDDMRLMLDFDRLRGVELPALMLLLLTLRDVAENRLPFGFATTRGMGEIGVENISLQGAGFKDELKCLNKASDDWLILPKGKFADLDASLKDKLKTEWKQWHKQNQPS